MPANPDVMSQIDQAELLALASKYGQPIRRSYFIQMDHYMLAYRGRKDSDRRGEVVFAIRQPNGEILLHTKHRYETPIYRLPTGGICRDESVESALFREIAEETGQEVKLQRFLGVLDCHFVSESLNIPFTSYVFYLDSLSAELRPTDTLEIADYRTVTTVELKSVANSLRNLNHERVCWGYWRSLAHNLVHDALTRSTNHQEFCQ